ncbi:MAG: hypothetical protein RMZ69_26475 [Nostoc sp. ChiQUE01a]|nr:hypothetical protein [Nostoc sp. ChiQUE01a]
MLFLYHRQSCEVKAIATTANLLCISRKISKYTVPIIQKIPIEYSKQEHYT